MVNSQPTRAATAATHSLPWEKEDPMLPNLLIFQKNLEVKISLKISLKYFDIRH